MSPGSTMNLSKNLKKRNRLYKKEERSPNWKTAKKHTDKLLSKSKNEYYNRIKDKLTEKDAHKLPYRAIMELKGGERPKPWDVSCLYPDKTEEDLVNMLADYFNSISNEIKPLQGQDVPTSWEKTYPLLAPYEVSQRIKSNKKPKSMVGGDLFPATVNKYHDLLAIPLTKIYNLVLHTQLWPSQWKLESVTIIPKTNYSSTPGECRNISCTPLFSKILESYMMERILSRWQTVRRN